MKDRGAVVICGGQSRRMGRPKATLPFGPERMLQRVVRLVGSVVEVVVVVAAPGQDLPDLPDSVQVVRDPVSDQGPLRGLATGLASLPESIELVYASATDVPFLHPAWVELLVDLIEDDDLIVPRVDGYLHPLAAIYRRAPVLLASEALLASGRHRPVFLLEVLRGRLVDAPTLARADPTLATLRNLNTPEDYRQALYDAGFEIDRA